MQRIRHRKSSPSQASVAMLKARRRWPAPTGASVVRDSSPGLSATWSMRPSATMGPGQLARFGSSWPERARPGGSPARRKSALPPPSTGQPGTTKTPVGTTRPRLRVHQCKHRLLRNLGRLAPPGKTYCTPPAGRHDTGLSTTFDLRRRIGRSCPPSANNRGDRRTRLASPRAIRGPRGRFPCGISLMVDVLVGVHRCGFLGCSWEPWRWPVLVVWERRRRTRRQGLVAAPTPGPTFTATARPGCPPT